jgi:hypothetical protein
MYHLNHFKCTVIVNIFMLCNRALELFYLMKKLSQMWWPLLVIPALGMPRQEEHWK